MISNGMDRYRQWDAAYVLGSLNSSERHEFEEHLARCDACTAAVVDLAGLPGLLAALTPADAEAINDGTAAPSPNMLPGLTAKVRRRRKRTRLAVAALVLGASAIASGLTVMLTAPAPPAGQIQPTTAINLKFAPVAPTQLSATGSLTAVPWGTRIDWTCRYTPSPGNLPPQSDSGDSGFAEYALVIVDFHGTRTQVATWAAGSGTEVTPAATTSLPVAQIGSIEIRSLASGKTILAAKL
ncbi:zf-HC2 domain-containing protein [Burkholderia sp. RS01]|jgi:RNA polymerase sigma-70 factor (ECF subfamily)|uniref:anti-sigma factor family protein n=1 Tax=unclassified Burkholderia TaxID=2613784 RepID=UPI003218C1F7